MTFSLKKYKSILLFSLVILSVFVVIQLVENFSDLNKLKMVNSTQWLSLFLVYFIYIFTQGKILQTVVSAYGIQLSFHEWFGLLNVTLFANNILPGVGLGIRGSYLKKKYQLSWESFFVGLVFIYFSELITFSLLGSLSIGLFGAFNTITFLLIGGLITFAFILISLLVYRSKFVGFNYLPKRLSEFLTHDAFNKLNSIGWKKLLFWTIVQFLAFSVLINLSFLYTGHKVSLIESSVVSALTDFSFFIRLLPNSIGTYDAAVVVSSLIIDILPENSLPVLALTRILSLIFVCIFGPLYSFILIRKS
jgi:uncharacterized membrane protein YbhN (UPF0104 family)